MQVQQGEGAAWRQQGEGRCGGSRVGGAMLWGQQGEAMQVQQGEGRCGRSRVRGDAGTAVGL